MGKELCGLFVAVFRPELDTKLSSGLGVEYRPKIQARQRPNVGLLTYICLTGHLKHE